MNQLLIFTDLDGTLLDHDNYSYTAAQDALTEIKRQAIPLILISSKTHAELLPLHAELNLTAPFVCENGAAVYWYQPENKCWLQQAFAPKREQLLASIFELRKKYQYEFTCFADCSINQIAELTGLSFDQAELASQREFTEPLLWRDSSERLQAFKTALIQQGFQVQEGGRFLSVMSNCDKSVAMAAVIERYAQHNTITSMALGDSFNDQSMLQRADIAVVIKSANSDKLQINHPQWIIHTTHKGPEGWQEAMDIVLPVVTAQILT